MDVFPARLPSMAAPSPINSGRGLLPVMASTSTTWGSPPALLPPLPFLASRQDGIHREQLQLPPPPPPAAPSPRPSNGSGQALPIVRSRLAKNPAGFKLLAQCIPSDSSLKQHPEFMRKARRVGMKTVPFSDEDIRRAVEARGGFHAVNQKGSRGLWKRIARDDLRWCLHSTTKPCSCGQNLKNRFLQLLADPRSSQYRMEVVALDDSGSDASPEDVQDDEEDVEEEEDVHESEDESRRRSVSQGEPKQLKKEPVDDPASEEPFDSKESQDSKEPADSKDAKAPLNLDDVKDVKEIKDVKDIKDGKDVKDVKETKDLKRPSISSSPSPAESSHSGTHPHTVRVWQTKLPEASLVSSLPLNSRVPALELDIGAFHYAVNEVAREDEAAAAASSLRMMHDRTQRESLALLDLKILYGRQKVEYTIILDGRSYKIDVSFASITAISFNPESHVLALTLSQQPEFWEEVPSNHKNGKRYVRCEDFTRGQAFYYRIHYVRFSDNEVLRHLAVLRDFDTHFGELPAVEHDADPRFPILPFLCAHDHENLALVYCVDCGQSFCNDCNEVLHRIPGKHDHFQRPITGHASKKRKSVTFDRCRCGTSGALRGTSPSCSCKGKRCPCYGEGRGCRNCGCRNCMNPFKAPSVVDMPAFSPAAPAPYNLFVEHRDSRSASAGLPPPPQSLPPVQSMFSVGSGAPAAPHGARPWTTADKPMVTMLPLPPAMMRSPPPNMMHAQMPQMPPPQISMMPPPSLMQAQSTLMQASQHMMQHQQMMQHHPQHMMQAYGQQFAPAPMHPMYHPMYDPSRQPMSPYSYYAPHPQQQQQQQQPQQPQPPPLQIIQMDGRHSRPTSQSSERNAK